PRSGVISSTPPMSNTTARIAMDGQHIRQRRPAWGTPARRITFPGHRGLDGASDRFREPPELAGWGMVARLAACAGRGGAAPPRPPGGGDVPAERAQGRDPQALPGPSSTAFVAWVA